MSLANTISAPVSTAPATNEVLTNLTRDYAGLTLFSVTGRCFGDDDDTTNLYWTKTLSEANQQFQYEMLSEDGCSDEEIQRIIEADGDSRPWGFIVDTTPLCEMSEDGKKVRFLDRVFSPIKLPRK